MVMGSSSDPIGDIVQAQTNLGECPRCCTTGEAPAERSLVFERWCPKCEMWFNVCAGCGKSYTAPMSPYCKDGHKAPLEYHPFIPYFDFALGKQVDSLRERHKLMREAHVDYRDKPSVGQLAERRDRQEQRRQERERGHAPGGSNRPSGRIFSR